MTELPTLQAALRETAERTYPRRRRPLVPALLVAAAAAAALLVIRDRDGAVREREAAATRTPATQSTPAPATANAPATGPTPEPATAPNATPQPATTPASGATPAPATGNAPAASATPVPAVPPAIPKLSAKQLTPRPVAPDDPALKEATSLLDPAGEVVKAWYVPGLKGHVLLTRKGDEYCFSAPDPAADQPDAERGVGCAPPARRAKHGDSIGIGNVVITLPPGADTPKIHQR
jgi:hypothetical protein